MSQLDLVRDILDKQLLDRNECEIGRVDGAVIELPEGARPRLVRLELGGPVLAARVGKWLVGPARKFAETIGPKRVSPVTIPWSKVFRLGRDVHVDLDVKDTKALAWEKWFDKHLIDRIPGAKQ